MAVVEPTVILSHHLHRLLQILGRNIVMQPPYDIHWSAPLVANIVRSTEECIRRSAAGVLLELTDK